MKLAEFVQEITDKRLPSFEGAGIRREGGQVSFGKGKGRFFLCQTLYVQKAQNKNDKVLIRNTAY